MRPLTALLLMVLLVVGCGGDDDASDSASGDAASQTTEAEPTTQAAKLSRAEAIERGDRLCKNFRERTAPLEQKLDETPESDAKKLADILREEAVLARKTVESFEALAPQAPAGDVLKDYAAKVREQLVLLERAADQIEEGDASDAQVLVDSGKEVAAELKGIAQGYGFKVCGSDSD